MRRLNFIKNYWNSKNLRNSKFWKTDTRPIRAYALVYCSLLSIILFNLIKWSFINGHFDDVIVMNHKYEVWFRKPWMTNFHILTPSVVDIVIPRQKISFPKMSDFQGNSHTAYVSLILSLFTFFHIFVHFNLIPVSLESSDKNPSFREKNLGRMNLE